jgi:putative transcriptional regulator
MASSSGAIVGGGVPSPSAPRRITNEIRTLRFLHGEMTQAELGERIGLTRQTVAAIEAGKYSPSLEAAFRIAEVFGKRLDEVFRWETTALPDERA